MNEREATVLDERWEVKRIAGQYEVALRRGETKVSIEQMLLQHPQLPQKQLLLALIETELIVFSKEQAAKSAYLRRFPGFIQDIEALLCKPLAAIPTPLSAGDLLGEYAIIKLVGRGTIGFVYLAEHTQTNAKVAIKILRVDRESNYGQDYRDLFRKEAVVNRPLQHPQIVKLLASGEHGGLPYHVFEYIDGQTLESFSSQQMIDSREAARIIADVADAIHFSHRCGVVHRDLKPSNILLDKLGRPHVADFGIALDHSELGTGACYVGTPLYMSPEQVRGSSHHLDGRSDIFSLGVILYQLTTGVHPFLPAKASQHTLKHSIEHIPAPPLRQRADVPKEFDQICMKALAKDPMQRFNTAGDFAAALRRYSRRRTRRNSWALAACALLLLLATSTWGIWNAVPASVQANTNSQSHTEESAPNTSATDASTGSPTPVLSVADIANLDSSLAAVLPKDANAASAADIDLAAALIVAGLKADPSLDTALWKYFGAASDNTLQTALIHLCAVAGVEPQRLIDRALIEPRPDIRAALLMALGSYTEAQFPRDARQGLVAKVMEWYCLEPHPEMHSACGWLLRRWGEHAELAKLQMQLRFPVPFEPRQWFTTLPNVSMIACGDFAISAFEITADQWAWVMGESAVLPHAESGPPKNGVSWHQCAAFCNQLSQATGLPKDQLCYENLSQDYYCEVPDAQLRLGFRMPTLAEWNYAARGTTTTARYWGRSDHFLTEYANCRPHSLLSVIATGSLKPNRLGLFDTLGNLTEWLHCPEIIGDSQGDFSAPRLIRGGSAWTIASGVDVESEYTMPSDLSSERMGLRIVQRLPTHHAHREDIEVELLTVRQLNIVSTDLPQPSATHSVADRLTLQSGVSNFLGVIQRGDASSRELVITNRMNTPLTLLPVITHGYVGMLNDGMESQRLNPEESTRMQMTLRRAGVGTQTIDIVVNALAEDGSRKTLSFPITTFVSGPATHALEEKFDGAGIMRFDFGRVAPGTAISQLITLSNAGNQPLTIGVPSTSGSIRTIRRPTDHPLAFQQHAYTEFELKPTAVGQFTGVMQMETNDALVPQVRIEVTVEAVELPVVPVLGVFRDGIWRLDHDRDGRPDRAIQFGQAGDIPCAGDFDGDGTVELAVIRRSDEKTVSVNIRSELPDGQIQVATRSLVVGAGRLVVGDFNGDGRSDFACVTNAPSGLCRWQVEWDGDDLWDESFEFGLPGDVPLSGDWWGTGRDHAAVFRRTSDGGVTQWHMRGEGEGAVPLVLHFGLDGDQPIAGDWNGDGKTDVGVHRFGNGSGTFLLDIDFDPASESYVRLGAAGDVPIAFMAPPLVQHKSTE